MYSKKKRKVQGPIDIPQLIIGSEEGCTSGSFQEIDLVLNVLTFNTNIGNNN